MAGAPQNLIRELAGVESVRHLSEKPELRECLVRLASSKHWIDQKHLEVCRIPAPTFQEEERAAWMADEFRNLGYHASIDRASNVIAKTSRGNSGPFVALTAHLDTVLAPRRPEDIHTNGNGRLEGPGVSDNGAGLAALLAIAACLKGSSVLERYGAGLLFVANVGEEGEGNLNGMRYLCQQSDLGPRIRSFVVIDGPSTERITNRGIASRRFEITVSGPGGHSWSDFGIGNPVHTLSRAITFFSDLRRNGRGNGRGNSSSRSTFNFGRIDGGASVNAIPVSAVAKLDLRSDDVAEIDAMSSQITDSVEQALGLENRQSRGDRLTAKIREIGYRPGGALREGAAIFHFVQAVDDHLRIRSQADSASTDANIPLSLGWDALSIGAGGKGGGAHTPDEWFDSAGREIGLTRVFLTVSLLLRNLEQKSLVAWV